MKTENKKQIKIETYDFQYVNPFKQKKWGSKGKEIAKECILPLAFLLVCLAVVYALGLILKIKSPYIMEPKQVLDETSDPTVCRLVMCIVDFVLGAGCVVGGYYLHKAKHEDIAFYMEFFAGTILWQSLGECLWHFGFVRIETYVSLPVLLPLIILFLFLSRKRLIPFTILVVILSFMTNWIGHFILMAPAEALKNVLPVKTTYLIFGLTLGGLFLIYSFYLIFFVARNKQARLISSIALYISVAEIVITLIEGLK